MAGTPVWSSNPGRTTGRNSYLASALNATTLVSIVVVVIFAVVTQLLAASGEISLSTTVQLTMWLVALGFIVLLAIAYMFFRVYETATGSQAHNADNAETIRVPAPLDPNGHPDEGDQTEASAAQKPNDAQKGAWLRQDAGPPENPNNGPPRFTRGWAPDGSAQEAEGTWVPPNDFRHLEGSGYSVSTEEVFPDGCYLVPDSITPVSNKLTGQQVYECRVVDRNPGLKNRPHETVVKILASQKPSQASMPRYCQVEFEHLTITPYVTDQDPMWIRYSLRATGLHPAAAPTGREPATWTVPPPRDVPPEETQAHVSTGDASSGAAGAS
jgi:hypothetical protein